MILSFTLFLSSVFLLASAIPQQEGVPIVAPPTPKNTGILPIPDREHPWIAPGHDDLRGPCPALNTLANHGYLPRNGIASFEEIVNANVQAYNMDYTFASSLAAFGMVTRGNAYINKLSIGLDTPNIPPLPDEIDGPKARGLVGHGRFEGDVSLTRQDAAIGDNVNFQPDLFAQLLDTVGQFGDNSTVTGPRSIVNQESLSLSKLQRFKDSQANNIALQYHIERLLLSYGETGLTLSFFANGTDGTLSISAMTSFFRDQKFPSNWHRRSSPGTSEDIQSIGNAVFSANPVPPGANAPNGTYVQDTGTIDACSLYNSMVGDNVPAILLNTTGVLKDNVDFLLNSIHNQFSGCPVVFPNGPSNV